MNEGSRNLLNAIRNDVLKAVMVTLAVVFATGLAGAVMSGAWQKGLLAACGLAVVVLVVILVAAAAWHNGELEEVNFEEMRSQDEAKRGVPSYERENREHVNRAAGRFRDEGDRHADCAAMVERGRRHMSKSRASSIELLLLNDGGTGPPGPIAQAGRFDQAVVSTPNLLLDWLDSLGDQVYECSVPVSGGRWRLLAIRDAAIDHHDRSEVQRLASWLVSLDMAHQIGADPLEESA